ncbi:TrkH family potassium uptake protein [Dialister sp.]|uniref:TrkH family potassium uptake protein n=1 Tax=Dialister sp. TaxID=1955814 RepID=UPI003F0D9E99
MNRHLVQSMLARILLGAGAVLLLPLFLSLYYEGPVLSFFLPALFSLMLFLLLRKKEISPNASLTPREGTAITALSWLSVSLLYAVPYILSGTLSPLDGLVESISGLTGTGATVINDLTVLPPSLLFFRAMTHWLGGLGIIVIFVALFPQAGRGSTKMVNAESTGPTSSKPLPRIRETALALFTVYVCFTAAAATAYMLWGMGFLEAVDHAFSTIATGGFSTRNESIAYYHSLSLELIVIFFMVISSANFGIYVDAWKRGFHVIRQDTEFRVYLLMVAGAALLITLSLVLQARMPFAESLREALFQSASLSSTTGFVSADFDQWPSFAKFILLLLIIAGGCGGSTAGGLKVIRLILLFKCFSALLKLHMHPRAVFHMTVGRERFSRNTVLQVLAFFFIYMALSALWAAGMMLDGIAFMDALGLAFSTMSNAGPAFGQFGATCTYAALPDFSKIIVCLSMLFGRLESITLLAIFIPSFWKKSGW